MEENKDKSIDEDVEEETVLPEKARQQLESYVAIKETERKTKEALHNEAMKDLEYRRWYYQNELQKAFDMIPREYYYQAEYEDMDTLCEKYKKKMDSLEKIEDFEALLKEFRKKTGKKLDANKIITIILVAFLIVFGGFLIFCATKA